MTRAEQWKYSTGWVTPYQNWVMICCRYEYNVTVMDWYHMLNCFSIDLRYEMNSRSIAQNIPSDGVHNTKLYQCFDVRGVIWFGAISGIIYY